jgi:hypothetical protein
MKKHVQALEKIFRNEVRMLLETPREERDETMAARQFEQQRPIQRLL